MWMGQKHSDPVSVSIRHWCEDVPGQPHRMIERVGRDEASAIAAWNSRAAIAATAQPAPARVPLTEDQIEAIWRAHVLPGFSDRQRFYSPHVYARAIEAAHGITPAKEAPHE
jgi:hypothetical protein